MIFEVGWRQAGSILADPGRAWFFHNGNGLGRAWMMSSWAGPGRAKKTVLCRPPINNNKDIDVYVFRNPAVVTGFQKDSGGSILRGMYDLTYIFNFWQWVTLALTAKRQSARISNIKNVG